MNEPRGTLPALNEVAFQLRISESEASSIIDELVKANLVDKSPGSRKLRIHGWEKRQRGSDNVATRVKRYRKRQCNVTETLPHACATEQIQNRDRGEREERERESPLPLVENSRVPNPVEAWTDRQQQCIDQAARHWGASNGDVIIGELLRTFSPEIVMASMDVHFERFKKNLKPAYLRKTCEGKYRDQENGRTP